MFRDACCVCAQELDEQDEICRYCLRGVDPSGTQCDWCAELLPNDCEACWFCGNLRNPVCCNEFVVLEGDLNPKAKCPCCSCPTNRNATLCWICDTVLSAVGFKDCINCGKRIRSGAKGCRYCRTDSDRLSQQIDSDELLRIVCELGDIETNDPRIKRLRDAANPRVCADLTLEQGRECLELLLIGTRYLLASQKLSNRVRAEESRWLRSSPAFLASACREFVRLIRFIHIDDSSLRLLTNVAFKYYRYAREHYRLPHEARALYCVSLTAAGRLQLPVESTVESLRWLASISQEFDDQEEAYDFVLKAYAAVNKGTKSSEDEKESVLRVLPVFALAAGRTSESQLFALAHLEKLEDTFERAEKTRTEISRLNHKRSWSLTCLGKAQERLGNLTGALTSYKTAMAHHGECDGVVNPGKEIFLLLGQCYERLGDLVEAEAYLVRAAKLNSGTTQNEAKMALLNVYASSGRIEDIKRLGECVGTQVESCYDVTAARLNSRIAAYLSESADGVELAQVLLTVSLGIYKQALSCFPYQQTLRRWLTEIWQDVEHNQSMLASIQENFEFQAGPMKLRQQAAHIKQTGYNPRVLQALTSDLFTGS